MILKCFVYDFEKLFNDFEMFFNDVFNDLSRRSKNFERDTYKGESSLSIIVQTAA